MGWSINKSTVCQTMMPQAETQLSDHSVVIKTETHLVEIEHLEMPASTHNIN